MISRIIKVEVRVISRSRRLRLITLTETLIILDITKTSSNNCLLLDDVSVISASADNPYFDVSVISASADNPYFDQGLLYIELSISFLIGRKSTANFRNQRP